MLIITRKLGEEVVIDGGRVVVVALEIRSGQVKLGFQAQRDVPIHRREIQDRIDREADRGA